MPPAGWYVQTQDANVEHWWDGQQWTADTRVRDEATLAARKQANPLATWGFVTALISFFTWFLWIPGPIAVVLSAMGLSRSTRIGAATGNRTGRGIAIAGLVIGAVYTVFPFIQAMRGLM